MKGDITWYYWNEQFSSSIFSGLQDKNNQLVL